MSQSMIEQQRDNELQDTLIEQFDQQEYRQSYLKKQFKNYTLSQQQREKLKLQSNSIINLKNIDDIYEEQMNQSSKLYNFKHFDKNLIKQQSDSQIQVKSDKQIRAQLMNKLAEFQLWAPQVEKQENHQSIIIFDWDDTLMASSFLNQFKIDIHDDKCVEKLPKFSLTYLRDLENQVRKILRQALKLGYTFIITNAGLGWIELTAYRFFPRIYKEYISKKEEIGIKIISAREMFEQQMPSGFKEWKIKAFMLVGDYLEKHTITNIIAIGDSQIELDAATQLSQQFQNPIIKTVKLNVNPTLSELIQENEMINDCFFEIYNSGRSLIVKIIKSETEFQQFESQYSRKKLSIHFEDKAYVNLEKTIYGLGEEDQANLQKLMDTIQDQDSMQFQLV